MRKRLLSVLLGGDDDSYGDGRSYSNGGRK